MRRAVLALLLLSVTTPSSAQQQSAVDALANCLADATSGRDRKDMVKWIVSAMAAHPEIEPMLSVTDADRQALNGTAGRLFTRLIADDCTDPMREVVRENGQRGVELAFENLGKIAMQELMGHPAVGQSMSDFGKFIDEKRIEAAIDSNTER